MGSKLITLLREGYGYFLEHNLQDKMFSCSGAFQNYANPIYETINEPCSVTNRHMYTTGLGFI